MAHKKITISVPEEVFTSVTTQARAAGLPLSGWIQRLIARHEKQEAAKEWVRRWAAESGPPTPEELAWAKEQLDRVDAELQDPADAAEDSDSSESSEIEEQERPAGRHDAEAVTDRAA